MVWHRKTICIHGWSVSNRQVNGRRHLSVETLRRWRWWHCDWGIVIWYIVRLILSSLLTLACKTAAESSIVSQFRMLALIQVSPYAFCQVSYLESEVREFESTSNSAQIILALVWVEWEFKNFCTHLFLNSCFVNRAQLALAIQITKFIGGVVVMNWLLLKVRLGKRVCVTTNEKVRC